MIIPGFALRHARTVASCASSSVKSHVSSNKATPRKGRVVSTLLTSRFSCCDLDWGFRFWHISSIFLSMAIHTRRGTDFVGWESSATQLKNPSETLKDSVTCSPDSTFCLDTSPRAVIWLSGRCPDSQINWRQSSLSTPFSCPCTFRGTVSRRSHVRVDKRGVRSRPVASLWTQALCDCSASSQGSVPPWSVECATTDSHTSRIFCSTSHFCLPSGSQSVDGRRRELVRTSRSWF